MEGEASSSEAGSATPVALECATVDEYQLEYADEPGAGEESALESARAVLRDELRSSDRLSVVRDGGTTQEIAVLRNGETGALVTSTMLESGGWMAISVHRCAGFFG